MSMPVDEFGQIHRSRPQINYPVSINRPRQQTNPNTQTYTRPKKSYLPLIIIAGIVLIFIFVCNNNQYNRVQAPRQTQTQTQAQPQTPAADYATVTVSALNVRRTPSSANNSNIIESIRINTRVEILERRNDGWVRIRYNNGRTGYVFGRYLSTLSSTQTTAPSSTQAAIGVAYTSSALNVRRTPSAVNRDNIIEAVQINTRVEILERRRDGWVHIRYSNGRTGYVDGNYLSTSQSTQTTRTISSVNWRWSENRIAIGTQGWSVGVQLFDAPVTNCMRFTLDYEFRRINSGDPYGIQDVYVMDTGRRWVRVGSFNAPNNNRVTTTIQLSNPTTILGIAVVPTKSGIGQSDYENWFAGRDFLVN
jgi:uncharacterized protein YgiM (DUF1202 family)